jgi:hypothetical protein
MKKPPDIVHGLEEALPSVVTLLCGVQHVGLLAINPVYPLLVFRVADTPTQAVVDLWAWQCGPRATLMRGRAMIHFHFDH